MEEDDEQEDQDHKEVDNDYIQESNMSIDELREVRDLLSSFLSFFSLDVQVKVHS